MPTEPIALHTAKQHLSESRRECKTLRLEMGILQSQFTLSIEASNKMRHRLQRIAEIMFYKDDCEHGSEDPHCAWCLTREIVEPWRVKE